MFGIFVFNYFIMLCCWCLIGDLVEFIVFEIVGKVVNVRMCLLCW